MLAVAAIDHALERLITEPTVFVKCAARKSPLERLQAMPYTTLCRNCKEGEEKDTPGK